MWPFRKFKNYKIIFSSLIFIMCLLPSIYTFINIPNYQRVFVGEQLDFNLVVPEKFLSQISFHLSEHSEMNVKLGGQGVTIEEPGNIQLQLKLFDTIPLKKMSVDVMPQYKIYPGGQSIGVLMQSKGVLTIGHSPIYTDNGQFFPAKEAGIREGDYILEINGHPVNTDTEIAQIIDFIGKKGDSLLILIKRNNKEEFINIEPKFCPDTKRYRIGLFVRDTTAGVGTMTFYDETKQVYGALGHVITDSDTNKPLDINAGRIVSAAIKGIEVGKRGQPGEKIGLFQEQSKILGTIEKNNEFGIYGKLTNPITHQMYHEPIPVALTNQIKLGKAEILTVVDEEKIEAFEIEIEKVYSQKAPNGRGLVIKITDERLLEITGGIIQGMSGSPIIQNGKFVGAVTHVFVNDPTRGYGLLAEWMLLEANIFCSEKPEALAFRFFSYVRPAWAQTSR